MKTPSRYMPKFKEMPNRPFDWLWLVLLLALLVWVIWRLPYLLFFTPIIYVVHTYNEKANKKHFVALLEGRENDSICTFSRHFKYKEVDTWVIRAVYEQLQTHLNNTTGHFPIRATDDVFEDLKIDDDDFEYDLVGEIAQRTNRTLDNAELNPFYNQANIVENLVFFFNEQPRANAR